MSFNSFIEVEESPTLYMNTLMKDLHSAGKTIYKFGFGQSPFQPPEEVIQASAQATHRTEYTHVQGDLTLREQIAAFHKEANNIDCTPDNIFIAPGSKILIYSILSSFTQADVLVASPSWVSYRPQIELCRHHLINIETNYENRWRVTPENLREAASRKKHTASICILNYPGNPDGLAYTKSEMVALAEVMEEFNILVISDEIYSLLHFTSPPESFMTVYPNTIVTSGLSKWCGAGGWRLGIAMLGDKVSPMLKAALIGIASETYSCASAPIQSAAKVAYNSFDNRKDYLHYQTSILQEVSSFCFTELNKTAIKLYPAQGGFYLFPDFSHYEEQLSDKGITTSQSLCERLLQDTGVALLPGTAFGMNQEELVARLAFVDFTEPASGDSFSLETHAKKVKVGIEFLTSWIKQLT